MPKVSLIIPVYNVEDYLEQCLDSAVNQTLDNYEIICVNDGSTDSSGEILNVYAGKYKQINVIEKENGGLSSARNAGLDAARGKYIYFLDSDDYIAENTLKELYEKAEADSLDLIYFNTEAFYEDETVKEKHPKYTTMYQRNEIYQGVYTGQTMFAKMRENKEFLCNVGIQFFRKEIFKENNLNFYPGIIYEDELFSLQFVMLAKRVAYVDSVYHHRRIHEGSIVTTPRTMKNVESHLHSYIEALSFIKGIEIEETAKPYIYPYINSIYGYALNGYAQMKQAGADTSLEDKDIIYQYVYEFLKKDAQKEKNRVRLRNKNAQLQKQLEDLKTSKSYRIGQAITYLPRKIKALLSK